MSPAEDGTKNEPAFAIVRVDDYSTEDNTRFTVKQVVWDMDLAEAEVRRLNELNAEKGCRYLWQATRALRRGPS